MTITIRITPADADWLDEFEHADAATLAAELERDPARKAWFDDATRIKRYQDRRQGHVTEWREGPDTIVHHQFTNGTGTIAARARRRRR